MLFRRRRSRGCCLSWSELVTAARFSCLAAAHDTSSSSEGSNSTVSAVDKNVRVR